MRLSSQQYRRMILATDLAWDPDHIPDKLVLYDSEGNVIDLLDVQGPMGPPGPPGGGDSVAFTAAQVLDVGYPDQIRAGRQLTNVDFTDMGLSIPVGLWNLSDLTDASGNGRSWTNKGAVPFAPGVNGLANTSAKFISNAAQALYIADTGAADPFRIRYGTVGCWMRTQRRVTEQIFFSKHLNVGNQRAWFLEIVGGGSQALFSFSLDGIAANNLVGGTDVCDDRWHFIVGVFDGAYARLYVDGYLDGRLATSGGLIYPAAAPLNIGAVSSDAGGNGGGHFTGRIDEAFITSDVLSEDQIRNLYCVKIPHTLGVVPTRASVSVRRQRRTSVMVAADFTVLPLRMYNFTGGSLVDEGSQNVPVVNNGVALPIAGVSGAPNTAFNFNGAQSLSSSDAGLPAALTARSYGCWFKTNQLTTGIIMAWGLDGSTRCALYVTGGQLNSITAGSPVGGIFLADGQWHHVVSVEDNAAVDGVKRRLYVDGKLINIASAVGANTLAGANRFRIGCDTDGTSFFVGQIDGVFVSGSVLTGEEIIKLYLKGIQALAPSPKNAGDHVEALHSGHVLAVFDTLDGVDKVDLGVAL